MTFNIGDRIVYRDSNRHGVYITGVIIDIWRNSRDLITGYFAKLDSGVFVHIQPDNNKWYKEVEPIFIV
ncbi:MAG TPA: hypothetical protein G4O15_13290 [Dehalococcoidia bacterium]|nr:hypothetical protein [Dehalococcoidia bacterium]